MSPALKRLVMGFCRDEFKRQVEFIRRRFEMDNYDPILKLTSKDRVSHFGGVDSKHRLFISITYGEVWSMLETGEPDEYAEYAFIKDDPDIGNEYIGWKEYLAKTISHELAHTLTLHDTRNRDIRDQVLPYFPHTVTKDRRDHGLWWQAVYRLLVCECVRQCAWDIPVLKLQKLRRRRVRKSGREFITYYIGRPIAYQFIKEKDGSIWRCDRGFVKPRKTTFKDFYEVRKWIMSRY